MVFFSFLFELNIFLFCVLRFYNFANLIVTDFQLPESREHKSTRALSTTNENVSSIGENHIRQITDPLRQLNLSKGIPVQSGTERVKVENTAECT